MEIRWHLRQKIVERFGSQLNFAHQLEMNPSMGLAFLMPKIAIDIDKENLQIRRASREDKCSLKTLNPIGSRV